MHGRAPGGVEDADAPQFEASGKNDVVGNEVDDSLEESLPYTAVELQFF